VRTARQKGLPGRRHRTKEYIAAGDVFQAVLSQRFDVEPEADSFQVYRALRTVNPSPYMFFLRFAPEGPLGGCRTSRKLAKKLKSPRRPLELAGSSPELLVRVHQGKVEYRPIAGTRPRGATEKKTRRWPTRCSTTKRSAPST
jgi:anthranilate synthase component 1